MRDDNYQRADKDQVYLKMAQLISTLSHDAQTHHGCIVVKDGRIISAGFNGFPPGGNDDSWPNLRPEKYPFCVHAEENAILNCAKQGINCNNAVAYITGMPCETCARMLISVGITNWKIGTRGHSKSQEQSDFLKQMIDWYDIEVEIIDEKNYHSGI